MPGRRPYHALVALTIFTTDSMTGTSMSMPTTVASTTLPATWCRRSRSPPDIQVMPLPHAEDATTTNAAMRKSMTTLKIADQVLLSGTR
jgi:hypothetical protein